MTAENPENNPDGPEIVDAITYQMPAENPVGRTNEKYGLSLDHQREMLDATKETAENTAAIAAAQVEQGKEIARIRRDIEEAGKQDQK